MSCSLTFVSRSMMLTSIVTLDGQSVDVCVLDKGWLLTSIVTVYFWLVDFLLLSLSLFVLKNSGFIICERTQNK